MIGEHGKLEANWSLLDQEERQQREVIKQALTGPAPCDDCKNSRYCKLYAMACEEFLNFTDSPDGKFDKRKRVKPTRALYQSLYCTQDIEPDFGFNHVAPDAAHGEA